MAKSFADMLSDAKPAFKDIAIVMNGQLAQERDELSKAVIAASAGNGRLANGSRARAQQALDEWDEAHADDALTIRVYACQGKAEWLAIRQKHTAKKTDGEAFRSMGYNPYDVAIEIIMRKATQVMDDGEEADIPDEAWQKYFGEIVTQGDLELMTQTVMTLHSVPSGIGFGDRKK